VLRGRALHAGSAGGPAAVLDEPLSFWGGLDPETGRIIDPRHPQAGTELVGRVLAMPSGRGSSSSSTVLAEAIRAGTAPAGIVLLEPDPILVLGAIVAALLYGKAVPVVVLDPESYEAVRTGDALSIEADGETATVRVEPASR
jgi:hypothetical protein